MRRYYLAALALKAFSLNRLTKWAYRRIGNRWGKRTCVEDYLYRGNIFLDFCERHDIIKENDELLELGTGWVHWHAIFLRLHFNISVTMFDVWDNRQFDNLVNNFRSLKDLMIKSNCALRPDFALLDKSLLAYDFDELYRLLDLQYVIDSNGSLARFADGSFDCVFSADVLEHIKESDAERYVNEIHRILKSGGYSLHYIACDDHLAHYDPTATPKSYLRFSGGTWKLFFENNVQYFNRLQKSDWLKSFENSGFKLIDFETKSMDLDGAKIAERFQAYELEDLACTALIALHQKPA